MTEPDERQRLQRIIAAHQDFIEASAVGGDAFDGIVDAFEAIVVAFQSVVKSVHVAHESQKGQLHRVLAANAAALELWYAKVPPGTEGGTRQ